MTSSPTVGPLYMDLPGMRLSEAARWVEELSFDSMWVGDHVLFYVDGLTAIAAMAGGTSRLQLGTAVYLLALRDPVLVARSLATLAREIPDRFVLGIGVGGDLSDEFEVLGIEVSKRARRVDHAIVAIREMLGGRMETYEFQDVPSVVPPMWIGGRSDAAARRAARLGNGFIPYLATPQQLRTLRTAVEAEAAMIERDLTGFGWAADVHISIDADQDAALTAVRTVRPFGLSDAHIDRYCVVGDSQTCLDRLQEYVAAGAEHLVLNFVCPPDRMASQIELFAGEVLPALQGR